MLADMDAIAANVHQQGRAIDRENVGAEGVYIGDVSVMDPAAEGVGGEVWSWR